MPKRKFRPAYVLGADFIRLVVDRWNESEPDILTAVKHQHLTVTDLDWKLIFWVPAPACGWTEKVLIDATDPIDAPLGADAFVGQQWVGSTEV